VVIVSYNGKNILKNCLQSVFEQTDGIDFEVIVSDNGSVDGSLGLVKELFPSVKLFENGENLGFAKANNLALPHCNGRYILLLNPDTVLQSNAIRTMVGFMDNHPDTGACGPKLLNSDGGLQFSARNFPSIPNQIAESLFLHKLFPAVMGFGELIMKPSFYQTTHTVDWVTGAALMIRRQALNDVGMLDERYFMYSEEKDWCFNARKKGWRIALVSEAEIMHIHGDSGTNPKLFSMMIKSKQLFYKKNYPPLKANALISVMRLNLALRAGLSRIAKRLTPDLSSRADNKLEVTRSGRRNLDV